ncbi:MAG: hypothetical protein OXM88_19780, partial [bacterium]|nr:hypothetical protein [bacterium]
AYRSDLPDRVASHFGISGRADDSMTPELFLVVVGVLMVLGLGMCMAVALIRRRLQPMVVLGASFIGAFVGALAAGILATTAIGQRGLERWQEATLSPWALILWIGGSLVVGSAAAWIASSLPTADDPGTGMVPPIMELAPGQRAFWTSCLYARWPLLLGLVALLVALGLAQLTEMWIGIVLLVPAIAMTTFSRIRVTADRSGLQVRYGFLGWPRTSVPLRHIATARAIDVRPTEWGGWGYRGSLTLMKRAAVVLRAGPGIRLDLHDSKVFVVTIDNPEIPARLLNAEASRLTTT